MLNETQKVLNLKKNYIRGQDKATLATDLVIVSSTIVLLSLVAGEVVETAADVVGVARVVVLVVSAFTSVFFVFDSSWKETQRGEIL